MTSAIKSWIRGKKRDFSSGDRGSYGFQTAPEGKLFAATNPVIDGDDCLHDCGTCTIKYPSKFSIDEEDKLYGFVKGWESHMIVATGKTDWVRSVEDEKGSIMEAVEKSSIRPNEKLMLSASNMPLPPGQEHRADTDEVSTTVLLLPAFLLVDGVTPTNTSVLINDFVNTGPINTEPVREAKDQLVGADRPELIANVVPEVPTSLPSRPCPHRYLILLCSQKTRDARCGQSAPLLRKEFERHLRPLGLYRDLADERPGGVGIYFISHVGGHKYSANVMIYRRAGAAGTEVEPSEDVNAEASQCIWLARVRPEDCENIVRYTILQGKVVKPERQLRGGFDRGRGLVSW